MAKPFIALPSYVATEEGVKDFYYATGTSHLGEPVYRNFTGTREMYLYTVTPLSWAISAEAGEALGPSDDQWLCTTKTGEYSPSGTATTTIDITEY